MALWRDPLDELIDDLERAVPAAAAPPVRGVRLEDLQWFVGEILWRENWDEPMTPDEVARFEQDPRYHAVTTQLKYGVRVRPGGSGDRRLR
jgi:hypothetical protein